MWFTETKLFREVSNFHEQKYWNKRVMAPSAFIMYLGVNEKLPGITHHNLLFSEDWRKNFDDIYKVRACRTNLRLRLCTECNRSERRAGRKREFIRACPDRFGFEMSADEKESYADKVLALMETEMRPAGLSRQDRVSSDLHGREFRG